MLNYLKSAIKGATSLFIAILGVLLVVWFYRLASDFYTSHQAKPYENPKSWKYDIKDSLGVNVKAKTKLIDGNLFVMLEVDGYPKFFDEPINQDKSIIIVFFDADGFKLLNHDIQLSDFTKIVDTKGNHIGLETQFSQYISIDDYKRFANLKVGWNLIKEVEKQHETSIPVPKFLDHCAPKISKAERLKRLAQYGDVRETSNDIYEANDHRLAFIYDGSLAHCN